MSRPGPPPRLDRASRISRNRLATVFLAAVVIVALGVMATTVENAGNGQPSHPDPNRTCTVDSPSDCSVTGQITTADGQPVEEDVRLEIAFGPRSQMSVIGLDLSGQAREWTIENPVGASKTGTLEAGNGSVRYETAPVGGYEVYWVVVATNDSDWDIELATDAAGVGSEPGSEDEREVEQGVAFEKIRYEAGEGRAFVDFELVPREERDERPDRGLLAFLLRRSNLPYLLIAVLAVGLVVLFAFARRHRRIDVPDGEDTDDDPDAESLAEIAGRAADRIEQRPGRANEVYRTWDEMTRALNVSNPEATTPGEFAERAVEAGMTEDDVTELTRLFEAVRYGDRDPAEYEDRAVATLRRIEDAYVGGEGDG